jgi:hypothetical protein
MQVSSSYSQSILAVTIAVFLLAFSFNAYACLLPLSGTTDVSMANGCGTPGEQPPRQLCDAFKTLGVESYTQSTSLLVDHHLVADHTPTVLPVLSHKFEPIYTSDQPFESSSPPHLSLSITVLRI